MRSSDLLICLSISISLSAPAASATVLTFDDVPDGTVINNTYSDVSLICFGPACPSNDVYARSIRTYSPPNVIQP
jgi:hypothetical protein